VLKKKATQLLMSAAMAAGLFAGGQSAYAQTDSVGLKDVYANYFRFGTILNQTTVGNDTMKALVLKQFNSITPENELKPDATIPQGCNGCTDANIPVTLQRAATILKFCEDNNIPVRGHTLVWHSQTPRCFFKHNFTDGGNWVTKEVMNLRMESYIKNMFAAIKAQYPNLNLYAYDVVNEAAKQSGAGARDPGDDASGGNSMWVRVYGDNSFIGKAFEYARQYAPPTTKLFYNDFNEYMSAKRDYIADSIIKPLKVKNLIDGMGMQSHVETRQGGTNAWPAAKEYGEAIAKYKGLGVEVQVTELDAALPAGSTNWVGQATYYRQLMDEILKGGDAITAVVVWGIRDDQSWIKGDKENPLLFNGSGQKKPAYDTLYARIPKADWGDGDKMDGGEFSLNVSTSPSGSGTVLRSPAGNGYYDGGAVVTLTPQASPGWVFKNWSGDLSGNTSPATVTMDADKNITAVFEIGGDGDYNIVKNGNFDGTSNWLLQKNGGSAGDVTTSGGKATITMTTAPTTGDVWDFQLIQNGLQLIEGKEYLLTFEASAASARTIGLVMQKDVKDWDTYYGADISLTAEPTPFEFKFTMENETDENGRIAFNIGGSTTPVTISNVKLVYVVDPPPNFIRNAKNSHSANRQLITLRGKTLNINAAPGSKVTVKLVNIRGKAIARFNTQGGANVSLRKIPAGVYVAEAVGIGDGRRMTSKLILK
jgi:GH35 family endo-1,4-beta-xylanase